MKKNIDIEKLFKEGFENFSAKPDANLFDKIQQQVNVNPSSSVSQVATKTATFTTKAKIAVIGVSSLIVGATVGYFVSNNANNNTTSTTSEKSIVSDKNSQNQLIEESPILANKKDEIKDKVIETKSVSKERVEEYLGEQSSNSTISRDDKSNVSNTNQNNTNISSEIEKMPKTNNNVKDISSVSNSSSQNTIVIPETTQDVADNDEKENIVLFVNPEANPKEGYAPVEIEFFAQSNADHYLWDFGDDKISEKANPIHSYDTPGIYTVTLEVEKNNVFETKSFEIKVYEKSNIVKLPSIITPNNDGNNDYFYIPSKGIEKMDITIYDSKNKVVYRSNNVNFKWDGNDFYGNRLTGDFTYIFTAVGKDGNIFKKTSGLKIVRQ